MKTPEHPNGRDEYDDADELPGFPSDRAVLWGAIIAAVVACILAVLTSSCATIPDPVPTEEGPDNAFIMDPVHGPNW